MKILILFAILATTAHGIKLPFAKKINADGDVDVSYGTAFLDLMAAYKRILPCGFAPWKLPPLAPFTLANWTFNFQNEYYRVDGVFTNFVITGLDNFRVMEYNYDAKTGVTAFDAIYYDVQVLAEFSGAAWAMIAGYNATVSGNGPVNLKVKDIRLIGQYKIAPTASNPNGLQISDFAVNVLIGDVENRSWNNVWDISFNNFFNQWTREFMLMWVQENQSLFAEMYDAWILPGQNKGLQNVTMPELIAFLDEQTMLMNAAECNPVRN